MSQEEEYAVTNFNDGLSFDGSVKETYVLVFTCRKVHLPAFKQPDDRRILPQVFSRMTSRRGLCHTVWSDNAKTFKAASNELKTLYANCKTQSQSIWDTLNQDRIESEIAIKGIMWKGGWWERFCRAVNRCVRS